MNSSLSSIANSHLSLKSTSDLAPAELFGHLYDIPKNTKKEDLLQVFEDNHIKCEIQI